MLPLLTIVLSLAKSTIYLVNFLKEKAKTKRKHITRQVKKRFTKKKK